MNLVSESEEEIKFQLIESTLIYFEGRIVSIHQQDMLRGSARQIPIKIDEQPIRQTQTLIELALWPEYIQPAQNLGIILGEDKSEISSSNKNILSCVYSGNLSLIDPSKPLKIGYFPFKEREFIGEDSVTIVYERIDHKLRNRLNPLPIRMLEQGIVKTTDYRRGEPIPTITN